MERAAAERAGNFRYNPNASQHYRSGTMDDLTDSKYYADLARKWASNPEDTVVMDGEYSAKHYALKARQAAAVIENMTATAATLATGQDAYANWDKTTGTMTFGIPRGIEGFSPYISDGSDGNTSGNWVDSNGDTGIPATGSGSGGGIPEAPADGKTYGRKDKGWVEVTGGGLPEGDLDMKDYKVINLKAGDAPMDGVNFKQLTDLSQRVDGIENITGSARRGPITISTDSPSGVPVQNEEWVQIGTVDKGAKLN